MTLYALEGLVDVNAFNQDWQSIATAANSTPAQNTGGGFFNSLMNFADKAVGFVDRNANTAMNLMEKYGQIKGKTKATAKRVNSAYQRNIVDTPRSRFGDDEWIPGIPNMAVIGGGAGVLLLVLLMSNRRSN